MPPSAPIDHYLGPRKDPPRRQTPVPARRRVSDASGTSAGPVNRRNPGAEVVFCYPMHLYAGHALSDVF